MSTAHDLQQQIIQAEAKVNELREKLNEQKNSERLNAIVSMKELIKFHQLSADLTELKNVWRNEQLKDRIARRPIVVTDALRA